MTDEQAALYATILANPFDDAPRLVYADWLDEHDDFVSCQQCQEGYRKQNGVSSIPGWMLCPYCDGTGRIPNRYAERAEFIRLQIGKGDNHWGEFLCLPESPCKGCRRERDLWNRFVGIWESGQIIHHAGYRLPYDWQPNNSDEPDLVVLHERGFVSMVSCKLAEFLAHASTIAKAHPITRWVLTDRKPLVTMGGVGVWWGFSDYFHNHSGHLPSLWRESFPELSKYFPNGETEALSALESALYHLARQPKKGS